MQYREVYRGFEVTAIDNTLVIRDIETGEIGKLNVEKKDSEAIGKMAHFVIDKRILERRRQERYRSMQFYLELRRGERYSHSYLVPEKVIEAGIDNNILKN